MCPRYIDHGARVNPKLRRTEVTLENFRQWFQPEFVRGLKKLYACGNYGDPIIARDTLEIYRYLRSNNELMALAMHTNGSARTRDWWKALAETMNSSVRGDYCTFSIDGLGDTNHLYRRNTVFDRIIENVEAFIQAGGVAHWDYIVFEHNEHQVEEARALAIKLGFENFNVKRTTRWSHYEDGTGIYPVKGPGGEVLYHLRQPRNENLRDETFKILRENLNKPNYVTNQEFDKLTHDDLHFTPHGPSGERVKIKYNEIEVQCRATKGPANSLNEIFLTASGHVFPCCFLAGEPWRYDSRTEGSGDNVMKMLELNGGLDSVDLHARSLQEILESPIYANYLGRSFQPGHTMRSRQCSTCCGKSWNKLDHGELGKKAESYFDSTKNTPRTDNP